MSDAPDRVTVSPPPQTDLPPALTSEPGEGAAWGATSEPPSTYVPLSLLAVVGVVLMLGACVNLVREAMEALRSNRLEVRFYRDLHIRRKVEGSGCNFG